MATKKTKEQLIARRAAQDVLNLIGAALIESGIHSVPPPFANKLTINRISALIETRLMEGTKGTVGLEDGICHAVVFYGASGKGYCTLPKGHSGDHDLLRRLSGATNS